MSDQTSLRRLPAVSRLLEHPLLQALRSEFPPTAIAEAVRTVLQAARQRLRQGEAIDAARCDAEDLARQAAEHLQQMARPSLRTVINATGVVLHTNLGRAPLSEAAAQAAYAAARHYVNLEIDLDSGQRSHRQDHVRAALRRISGAESATVVNNCAAATILTLRGVAAGKEVIVSRGQLIEIGGSFRIPEIMAVSGAILREVGTTNITRLSDYERAIGPNTAALMRIHTSNYRIRGFTRQVSIAELVALGRRYNLVVIDDIGSGLAAELNDPGWSDEPTLRGSIAAGADLVLCSGDKLLGGPQAGIILGRSNWIQRLERDPLMRAVRPDKITLAALLATLGHYVDPTRAVTQVPVLAALTMDINCLRERSLRFVDRLRSRHLPADVTIGDDITYAGGGSLPDVPIPTITIAIRPRTMTEAALAARLRTGTPPVVARVADGSLRIDLRTVFPEQEAALADALSNALTGSALNDPPLTDRPMPTVPPPGSGIPAAPPDDDAAEP